MKRCLNVIGILLVLLLFSFCVRQDIQQIEGQGGGTHTALVEIDSLMWRQADSAFVLLQKFVVSPEVEELDTFDGHYCQLLISELLYKNDCEQTNRKELLQAVSYFDSLVRQTPPFKGAGGIKPPSLPKNCDLPFLTARVHYINGVGYYEKDSIVQACAEYLKSLEVMENRFEDKDLIGNKAIFLALTYGRLGEMFSELLLTESTITCYQQALVYCKREPTSIYGISNLLHGIGIQFDITNQKDSAAFYYDQALVNLPNYDNIHYRDIITSKSVLAYNLGFCIDSVINSMKYIISLTRDEHERICRFLTLGNILYESRMYDSSRFYLETVFEQQDDIQSKIVAAENLCNIYQKEGDSVKAQKYSSYLADFTMAEIEKKKDVSRINEKFKNYLAQKQDKQAEINRENAINKVIKIIIPIALIITLVIIILAKLRSKNLLKEQQETADRMLVETEQKYKEELQQRQAETEKTLEERDRHHAEAIEVERQTHRMEQAAISGRLKRSNQELRELKDQIKQLDDLATKTEVAASFNEEPICRLIMERVHDGQFKSKIDCELYKSYALGKQQLLDLRMAADRHYDHFTLRLRNTYPKLTSIDIDYCCLYLLNLTYADVSALMQRAYNTVVERDDKIQKIMGTKKPLHVILMNIAHNNSSI